MHQVFFFFPLKVKVQFGLPSGQWGRSGPWKEAVDNFDHSSSRSLLYRRCTQCWLHVGGEGIERWRGLRLGTEWGRQLVWVSLQWGASAWAAETSVKEVTCGVCASSMGHPAPFQVVQETTVWTRHVLGPAVYVVFSKGPILRKAYHRRRTRSRFIALAGSLPFFPPWVWHLGSPAVVWRPLSWGGWALMMVISAFYLPSEGRLELAVLRLTQRSESLPGGLCQENLAPHIPHTAWDDIALKGKLAHI